MTKDEWIKKIRRACSEAKTYRPFFDDAIEQLASILEVRDAAAEQYSDEGEYPIINYTNKAGKTNKVKNPALTVIDKENELALAYWRDLGLMPAGYKKLNGEVTEKRGGSFEAAIQEALK